MSIIEANGVCVSEGIPLGKGSLIQSSKGVCVSVATLLGKGTLTASFYGVCVSEGIALGFLTKVIQWTVSSVSSTKIRIVFDRGMTDNSDLIDVLNYTLTSLGGGVSLYLKSVEKENKAEPTFIDIVVSEMTNGYNYQCEIDTTTDGPQDTEGTHIDSLNNTKTFVGLGTLPTISSVVAIGENRVDVVFSEPMKDNIGIRDVTKYSFDKNLSVLDVLDVDGDTVKLVTSDQLEGELYTLTIAN